MDTNTQRVMFSSETGEYGTPILVSEPCIQHFRLDFDGAASHENHLLPDYATQEGTFVKHFSTPYRRSTQDGLEVSWAGRRVWCNPPYGRKTKDNPGIEGWVRKAALEQQRGCSVSVLLLPVRTETDWFQRWVFPYAICYWITGRLHFIGHDKNCLAQCIIDGKPPHSLPAAPFPSVLAVYKAGQHIPHGQTLGRCLDLTSDPEFTELEI